VDREPAFTETVQIGIVVRDLEATMRVYVDDYGIGPWEIYEFNPENLEEFHEYGTPVGRSWRLAATMVGQVQWELIQPLDDQSIYARFLAEKGEGIHHIAVTAPEFDHLVVMEAEKGRELPLSGVFSGIKVAYLGTDRDLGVMTEIYSGTPSGDVTAPDATYP
jgi:glyoxalase/bleomycin resistance protein/dioxygenase superfamily protein